MALDDTFDRLDTTRPPVNAAPINPSAGRQRPEQRILQPNAQTQKTVAGPNPTNAELYSRMFPGVGQNVQDPTARAFAPQTPSQGPGMFWDPRGLVAMSPETPGGQRKSLAMGLMDLSDKFIGSLQASPSDYAPNQNMMQMEYGVLGDETPTPKPLDSMAAHSPSAGPLDRSLDPMETAGENQVSAQGTRGQAPAFAPAQAPGFELDMSGFAPKKQGELVYTPAYERLYGSVGEQRKQYAQEQLDEGSLGLEGFRAQTYADQVAGQNVEAMAKADAYSRMTEEERDAAALGKGASQDWSTTIIPPDVVQNTPGRVLLVDKKSGAKESYPLNKITAAPNEYLKEQGITKDVTGALALLQKLQANDIDMDTYKYIMKSEFEGK